LIPIAYNLRNLAVRRTTTLAAGFGLALVVFVLAGVLMLSNGIKKTLGRSGSDDTAIVIRKGSDGELASGIEEPNVGLVLAQPGVKRDASGNPLGVGEIVVVILLDKLGTTGQGNVQVRGVPDNARSFRSGTRIVEGRPAQPGTDEVIVGKAIAGRFSGLRLGQSFELRKNRPVSVVGVFEDGGSSFESEVWADRDTVRTAFGREGSVSSLRARLESRAGFDAFKLAVESNRQLNLEAMRETDYYDKQSEGTSLFVKAMGLVIAVFFAIGATIGAMITMYASVAHRQKEIGTLRAIGFARSSIILSFLFESFVLAIGGGAVGALSSLALSSVKLSVMNYQTFSEVVIAFEPTFSIIGAALLIAGVMGILGGFFPAVRAARVNPVEAMRD